MFIYKSNHPSYFHAKSCRINVNNYKINVEY